MSVASDPSRERGATAVLVALCLVVLFGFAALAVDAGLALGVRRQHAAAADVGALAAVQFARSSASSALCSGSGPAYSACRGAEEAIEVVEGTLPGVYDLAAWASCSDPSRPAEFTRLSSLSDCISFTASLSKARVRLPGIDMETEFARVIGINEVQIGALAEAEVVRNESADVLPFAIGPTGAGQNLSCLKANTTQNLDVQPCNGPDQGNFGMLDLAVYGNPAYGTPQICGNAMPSTKMSINIIMGADHPIETSATTPGTVQDFSNCPNWTVAADNLATQTGNAAGGISQGLWGGISTPAREGRITCKEGDSGEGDMVSPTGTWPCRNVNNQMPEHLDHTPLWHYLGGNTNQVFPAGSCDSVSSRQQMEICLQAWRDYGAHPPDSYLFSEDIEFGARFGAVPVLQSDPSNGTGNYNVIGFQPTYIQTVYLGCNANRCDIVYSPGELSPGGCPNPLTSNVNSCGWFQSGNKNLRALTGFMLRTDMLHPDVRSRFPGSSGAVVFNLSR